MTGRLMRHSSANASTLNATQMNSEWQAAGQLSTNRPLCTPMQVLFFTCMVVFSVFVVAHPAVGKASDEAASEKRLLFDFMPGVVAPKSMATFSG